MFIGRLNNPTLIAGIGLGTLLVNVAGISITTGVWGGLDTLVSQAFGNKNYYEWGAYLNRCRIVLIAVFIPQALIFWNSESILVVMGQDQEVALAAQTYVRHLIPGIFWFNMFETTRRFLNAQLKFLEPSIAMLVALILHFFWWLLFISYFELNITGAAIATWITYITDFALIHLYVILKSGYVKE